MTRLLVFLEDEHIILWQNYGSHLALPAPAARTHCEPVVIYRPLPSNRLLKIQQLLRLEVEGVNLFWIWASQVPIPLPYKKLSYRWQTARCCFVKLLRYCRTFYQTRKVWLPDGEKNSKICLFVLTSSTNVTDRRTDWQTEEQTDTAWQHRPRLHSVTR